MGFRVDIREAQELYPQQRDTIISFARKCRIPDTVYLKDIKLLWYPELKQHGWRGAFDVQHKNCVFLAPVIGHQDILKNKSKDHEFIQMKYRRSLKEIVPVLMHELEHIEQFNVNGPFKYMVYSWPILRTHILEPPAVKAARKAAEKLHLDPRQY